MIFTDLIEKADVGASAINTLAKRGFVEIFVQEVRRDPLADVKLPDIQNLILTDEQTAFWTKIETALKREKYQSVSASRRYGQRQNRNLYPRDDRRVWNGKIRLDARAGNRADAGFFQTSARRFRR